MVLGAVKRGEVRRLRFCNVMRNDADAIALRSRRGVPQQTLTLSSLPFSYLTLLCNKLMY